jgi:SCY1-like protein 2
MFAAATSFFARTAISQSYNIGGTSSNAGSRSSTPGPAQSPGVNNATFSASFTPTVTIGLWKVQSASHKVTNKRVSVWTFDKRSQEMERLGPMAKERTLEVLKAEVRILFSRTIRTHQRTFSCAQASALGRLRHPSILGTLYFVVYGNSVSYKCPEMVEPLEETRNELIFATEPILASLELAIPSSGRFASLVELDEVEVSDRV